MIIIGICQRAMVCAYNFELGGAISARTGHTKVAIA